MRWVRDFAFDVFSDLNHIVLRPLSNVRHPDIRKGIRDRGIKYTWSWRTQIRKKYIEIWNAYTENRVQRCGTGEQGCGTGSQKFQTCKQRFLSGKHAFGTGDGRCGTGQQGYGAAANGFRTGNKGIGNRGVHDATRRCPAVFAVCLLPGNSIKTLRGQSRTSN